jgi:uncharacterized protein YndB with AHSA1/START domain
MEAIISISIEKTINVPVEKVWYAWTDPALVMKWFGSDPNGKVLKAILDVRPGGYFEITFNDSDQTEHTCSGIYKDVQKFKKLTFSWMWKSEPDVESFVTLSFADKGNATQMQFDHSNTGNDSKHVYLKGWQDTFSKLERMLTE